jgi:hypothetical protein
LEAELRFDRDVFTRASEKAVKNELQGGGWPVYEHYEITEENGKPFVVAAASWDSYIEFVSKESVVREGERIATGRGTFEDGMILYAPLRASDLVVELAELADKEITPDEVLGWAQVYGLLSIPGEDTVYHNRGGKEFEISGCGRRESVLSFAEAAKEVRACLRIYEALTSEEGADIEHLSSLTEFLPIGARRPWERREGEERSWLLRAIGSMVSIRLGQLCFQQMTTYTRGGLATGRFALSSGFKNLLGAIWLHMAWLLEAHSESVRRCKLPSCLRVIHFESGEPPTDPGLRKNVRGKYKTRIDREFCRGRGCKQLYHYRKKKDWPGYN